MSNRHGHILLADDDEDLRELLCRWLTRQGHVVTEVSDGEELLAALKDTTPDLIISDLQMPLLSGIEALSKMRRTDWSIPFILMTGTPGRDTHDEANRLGAAYILHKPLNLEYLCGLVQGLVSA